MSNVQGRVRFTVLLMAGLAMPGVAPAEAPTNAELYEMIQELRGEQERLQREAAHARAQAAEAQEELARTRGELERTRAGAGVLAGTPDVAGAPPRSAPSGLRAELEGLYVHHASADLNKFAGDIDGIGGGTIDPDSYDIDTRDNNPDGGGVRATLGWGMANGWDASATYTGFFLGARENLGQAAFDRDNVFAGDIDRALADDASLNGEFDEGIVDSADEDVDLDHHILDLDVARHFALTDDVAASAFVGIRATHLDLDTAVEYVNREGATDLDSYLVSKHTDLWAGGLRLGGTLRYAFGESGLSVYTTPAVSVLVGRSGADRRDRAFNQSSADVEIRDLATDQTSVVPVLEAELGIQFDGGPFFLRLGYFFSNWFDAAREVQITGVDDIFSDTTAFEVEDHDVSYGAAFLRAGFEF